ncbi:hypothetical protein MAM1_0384c10209 [Mucor ambiguus]|uniref:Uncharacterized protein n=1 Tax=Mucor ambiguus TaxID=91626 RepID=A0A0C9MTA0_9FUNG|nr:hypothetical protein MAM1_0384c10209 [Mucor ambiguus]
MNVDLVDRRFTNEKHGAYAFRIHESAHHLMSPELIPNPHNAIQQSNGIENIQLIFRAESDTDIRRYNAPNADEIDVLIVDGEDESSIYSCNRDAVLCLRGDEAEGTGLHCINKLHQHYGPLHYVLMFPTGELGWINFRHLLTGHANQHWHYRKRNNNLK